MELILVRHPRTTAPADVCVGQLDVGCAAGWEAHAARLARVLPTPTRLVSSPLARCAGLARALAASHGVVPEFEPRLMELSFGRWEGRRWADIDRAESDPWAADYLDRAPPGGESYRALSERVTAVLEEVRGAGGRVVLVTHAGPVRALLAHCLGLAPASGWRFEVGYGRLTRLAEHADGWRLEVLNA